MLSDADAAALYDTFNPWDPEANPGDRFCHERVMAADSVLDVGCGTGAMLHRARADGHRGRLVGLDPDTAALDRARRRADITWIEARAAGAAAAGGDFALATMTGHAFQFLVDDDELRASLAAVRDVPRDGGRFVFETRHPQARAWEDWNPSHASDALDGAGRPVRVWHEVDSVRDGVVAFHGTTAAADGSVLRVEHTRLRFLETGQLDTFLAEAGLTVEARYGDWHHGPLRDTSREIVTVARR
ncbi:methyltransferase domain-containing protein [Actinacidiphila acidipaludis]|uniref:Class I SAM-dependent methyltransferase n=1 Tax=Actinacidiphila acidipaludis TaxID=2873382 RepID=A0ABS7Q7C4_9ACTN|nr:class I SAM-dependent methyltransferase [Streptomyces acidipaludis]MBY8879056.1 class I SAM-dependent methyltransferase [Streptomyces acidipaludis]